MSLRLNPEQRAGVEAEGAVFVSAGAGSGKTTVLVERYARLVLERGIEPDRIVAITFTERAATQLQARLRARFAGEGRPELARAVESGWISTIHGFASRLLRRHAIAAGIDPGFQVLDATAARLLQEEAYGAALEDLVAEHGDAALDLVTAYTAPGLQELIEGVHRGLRDGGHPIALPAAAVAAGLGPAIAGVRAAAADLPALIDEKPGKYAGEAGDRAVALLALLDAGAPPQRLLRAAKEFQARGKLERFEPWNEALAALEQAARTAAYSDCRPLLDELLRRFDERFAALRRLRSGLDFDDLQLELIRLLDERPEVRAELQASFSELMVDEFQDTNALQCGIVDRLTGPETGLFLVGDEFQSIYRFRQADVGVFRERRRLAAADPAAHDLPLRANYRSQPEILAAVNHIFQERFGAGYEPLQAGLEASGPADAPPRVELILVDKDAVKEAGGVAREVEAARIAERISGLIAGGECRAGDVALLFTAGTDADLYEAALNARGLETVAATGRGFFAVRQVADVMAYLRLLRNRGDDFALLAVLASPLVGVSNDAFQHLRNAAPKRSLFSAIEQGLPGALGAEDARLIAAFRQRYDRLIGLAGRLSLAQLLQRVIAEHDYDLALLYRRDGARLIANLEKLVRIARDFEAARGPDLEGFIETVDRIGVSAKEAEAVAAEEGGEAIRLMTVHGAKGLEFPVVVVADGGRQPNHASGRAIVVRGDVGIKVPDGEGAMIETPAFDALRAQNAAEEADEAERVAYVALTRACTRLIVAGVVDGEAPAKGPSLIARVAGALGVESCEAALLAPAAGVAVRVLGGNEEIVSDDSQDNVEVEVEVSTVAADAEIAVAEPPQLALFGDPQDVAAAPAPRSDLIPPPLAPLPPAPAERPERLSFSALDLFDRCGLRFQAERLLGLHRRVDGEATAAAHGAAVHAALEQLPRGEAAVERVLARALEGDVEALQRARAQVGRFQHSALAGELGLAQRVQREAPFLLERPQAAIAGRFDLIARSGETVQIVDYKTGRLGERDPAAARDADYALQEAVYALAALGSGAAVVDVSFCFLEHDDAVATRRFSSADRVRLAEIVDRRVDAVQVGPYLPRPSQACADCPALGLICAGPELEPLHAAADAWAHGAFDA